MGKHKAKRESRTSAGNRQKARVRRDIRRTKMKINRWRRYQSEEKPVANKTKPDKRWNVSGLESHLSNLQNLLK